MKLTIRHNILLLSTLMLLLLNACAEEEKAFDEINENVDLLFDDVKEINHDIEEISKLYKRVYERFGFPYGSYQQEEPCINCGKHLEKPRLSFPARLACL